ncbi:hypothetical protein [Bordetella bronchiseptica]|uniref:hypothetical protein n=1 Tax=Bordetella bronchiseptica TaxID=518 RepID=UPI0004A135BD|nr:hypothetical protein [Bordetella bronchiseptica]KDB73069.1 hypothetical protein AZ21_2231 [Bordetella bronchiseptica B20-10725633]
MTETEKTLKTAAGIAKRTFIDPSEGAVLDIFKELCAERDRTAWANEGHESATIH